MDNFVGKRLACQQNGAKKGFVLKAAMKWTDSRRPILVHIQENSVWDHYNQTTKLIKISWYIIGSEYMWY